MISCLDSDLLCSADEAERTPAEETTEAPPTPLAWSDEAFLNAEVAELADQMLAEIDFAAITAEHGSLGAFFQESFAEMRGELDAEVEAGNMSEGTAAQFASLTEELVDQLISRVDSRTLNEEEALNQFVYGFVRVLSVHFEMEDDRITDEEAGRRIEALRRELRERENENREYAALMPELKIDPGVFAISIRIPAPPIWLICDPDGKCQPVDSLKRGKDTGRDAAAD